MGRRSATTASTTTTTSWSTAPIRSARRSRAASPSSCTSDVDFGTIAPHGASVSREHRHDGRDHRLRDLRARRRRRPRRPLRARRDGGRPARLQAGAGQRARRRAVPRGREPELRSQPRRLRQRDGQSDGDADVPGAAARRLLADRPVVSERAGRDDRDAVDRLGRDARDLRQRHGRRRQRPHRLPGRRLHERCVLRRQPSASPTSTSARWWSTARRARRRSNLRTATDDYQPTCSAGVAGRRHRDRVHAGRGRGAGGPVPADRAQHLRALPHAARRAGLRRGPGGRARSRTRRRTRSRSSACRRAATCSSSRRRARPRRERSTCGSRRSAAAASRSAATASTTTANGLTDCDDPDVLRRRRAARRPPCIARPGPRQRSRGERGGRSPSTRASGGTLYPTSCSRGTGKERVLRVKLTQPMSLGHDCMDGGSHVFALSRQVQPLDACNETSSCASIPRCCRSAAATRCPSCSPASTTSSSRRSRRAARAWSTLTLTGIQETIREICDNGIDDDSDGAIDCADRKCVTEATARSSPAAPTRPRGCCRSTARRSRWSCRPRWPATIRSATTCASAAGGQDGVIDFQVPATADVTMQWAQVGDHDFALYDDEGMLLACDAGTLRALRGVEGDGDRHARVLGAAAWPLPPGRRRRPARAKRAGWCCSCPPSRRRCRRRRDVRRRRCDVDCVSAPSPAGTRASRTGRGRAPPDRRARR